MPVSAESVSLSRVLAQRARRFANNPLPGEVAARATHLILDGIGVALAASVRGEGRVLDTALRAIGAGTASVIGSADGLGARDAACLNGMVMHSIEYDDTHMASVLHPTSVVFPAAFAAAQMRGTNGATLLQAYVAGVEVAAALGMAATGAFQKRGFHPTGVVGVFGATIAAGLALGLDEEALVASQGLALSMASGSMQFLTDGGRTKAFHAGWAAQSGLTAAVLAGQGLTAPAHAYEGAAGLFRIFLGLEEPPAQIRDALAPDRFELLEVAVKPFPAAYYTHASIEAAIRLHGRYGGQLASVDRILATVPLEVLPKIGVPLAAKRAPATGADAQFALPYLVAAALARGRFGLAELEDEARADPAIVALASRVECRGEQGTAFPRLYPGAVRLEFADGRNAEEHIPVNFGASGRPVPLDFILTKYHDNAARWDADRGLAPQVRDRVMDLPAAPTLEPLSALLTAGPAAQV